MTSMTVFDELTVVDAINARLATIPGLKTYRLPAANMETPCAIPMLAPMANQSFGHKVGSPMECNILVLCNVGDLTSGPELLFEFTSFLGARSIKLALEADDTLGGVVSDVHYIGPDSRSYERFDGDGNLTYVGRFIRVKILP
jgi:hypothetical protein